MKTPVISSKTLALILVFVASWAAVCELYAGSPKGQIGLPTSPPGEAKPAAVAHGPSDQSEDEKTTWRTDQAFDAALQNRQTVQWERMTLGQILEEAQSAHQIKIWIDRRVDISQRLTLTLPDQTVQQSLVQLANQAHCEVAFADPLVLFLPQGQGAQYLLLRADHRHQIQQLPAAIRTQLMKAAAVQWPRLTQPSELWNQWLPEANQPDSQLSLPHDVWRANDLPPIALADRLHLLAFGFGKHLQWSFDNKPPAVNLIDISEELPIQALLDASQQKQLQEKQDQWTKQWPAVDLEQRPDRLVGPLQAASQVLRFSLQPAANPAVDNGQWERQRFTLKTSQQPAVNILNAIAAQTKLNLTVAPEATQALTTRIDLDVQQVTLDQLLEEVAKQCQVEILRQGQEVQVQRPPQ